MKKIIYALVFLLFGANLPAVATHILGGEISYLQTGPATYQVTFKYYNDCQGASGPTSAQLNLRAPGCNIGRNIMLNLVSSQIVNPYGPSTNANCTSASNYFLYRVTTFTGSVTFSAAEQACPDWVLSWTECCRTRSRNIQENTAGPGALYVAAHLKLLPNVVNSSPEFDPFNDPLMIVNKHQDHVLSMSAHDPDGDSLVYTLVAPLENANTPVTYQPITLGSNIIFNPDPLPPYNALPPGTPGANPQFAFLPLPLGHFSPTFPMLSYQANWNAINPATGFPYNPAAASPYFSLDSLNGEIKFNTNVYFDSVFYWHNRYLVAIKVEEFRTVNGVVTKLGSIQRETLIQIIDGGPNTNPQVNSRMDNNQPNASGTEIVLQPGMPLNLQVAASDPNSTDIISMESNVNSVLAGAIFTATSGNAPTATVSWTPTAADVRQQPYYFQVRLRDNANPLRGVRTETFAVRVSNTGGVTGTKDALTFNAAFTAYPNPFTNEVNFRFNPEGKAESILIYNMLGRQVDQIPVPKTASGHQHIRWQNAGKHAAGMYIAKLISANKTIQTLKFTKLQ